MIATPQHWKIAHVGAFIFCIWLLGGCQNSSFSKKVLDGSFGANQQNNYSVERDVEAPDVFSTSEAGFWDDRPSLGGFWVGHPEIDIPERIIIRNGSNEKFVICALFRQDQRRPGPRLVLSTRAAEAIGMSVGHPANIMVITLRKHSITENIPDQNGSTIGSASGETKVSSSTPTPKLSASKAPPAKLVHFDFEKLFIQIGIFAAEKNVKNTADSIRQMGTVPIVKTYKRNNRMFWHVLVGPASTAEEQMTLFSKSKNGWI